VLLVAVRNVLLIATTVSAAVSKWTVAQPENSTQPVITKADAGHQNFLGKSATNTGCGSEDPDCGQKVSMVLKVNDVLTKAEVLEKKTEVAQTESKKLVEIVNEVKSASKKEAGAVAAELAAEEKVQIAKAVVKNEESEIRQKEQVIEQEKSQAKKITDPQAKAVVQKDEGEMEAVVKEEKVEAEVALEKEQVVEQAAAVVEMKAVATKANAEAKEAEEASKDKSLTQLGEQIKPKVIYKVEMKLYNLQTEVVKKAGEVKKDKAPTAAEQIQAAEVPKIQLAVAIVNQAKVEANEAKVEQEKAKELLTEVKQEAQIEKVVDKVVAKFGSVKKLEIEMKECASCLAKA